MNRIRLLFLSRVSLRHPSRISRSRTVRLLSRVSLRHPSRISPRTSLITLLRMHRLSSTMQLRRLKALQATFQKISPAT